jgi:hypothetical protein
MRGVNVRDDQQHVLDGARLSVHEPRSRAIEQAEPGGVS